MVEFEEPLSGVGPVVVVVDVLDGVAVVVMPSPCCAQLETLEGLHVWAAGLVRQGEVVAGSYGAPVLGTGITIVAVHLLVDALVFFAPVGSAQVIVVAVFVLLAALRNRREFAGEGGIIARVLRAGVAVDAFPARSSATVVPARLPKAAWETLYALAGLALLCRFGTIFATALRTRPGVVAQGRDGAVARRLTGCTHPRSALAREAVCLGGAIGGLKSEPCIIANRGCDVIDAECCFRWARQAQTFTIDADLVRGCTIHLTDD